MQVYQIVFPVGQADTNFAKANKFLQDCLGYKNGEFIFMVISNFHSCIYYTYPSLMKIGENTRFPKYNKRKYVFFSAPKSENIYRKVES